MIAQHRDGAPSTASVSRPARSSGGVELHLRVANAGDAERCGVICHRAFTAIARQHGFPSDFPEPDGAVALLSELLATPNVHAVVAEQDGRIVGSNFLWETAVIAGVGPITVDPAVQDGSIGRALMMSVLERARERRFAGVRLVQAAYHSRSLSLYAKLGFVVREPLAVLQGQALREEIRGYFVRAARTEDLPACSALCRRVHGFAREQELQAAVCRRTASVVEHSGRIAGYATDIGFFGHAVAESNAALRALVGAADGFTGPGFLVPLRNADLLRWCLDSGLRIVQTMTLMSTGLYGEPDGAYLPSVLY